MKYFRLTFIFLILAEILSFCGFLYPGFNKICFLTILLIALVLSLWNFEHGIYIIFAELFAGSFGYLFFYDFHGTAISLRIGLFLVIMSVWLAKMASQQERLQAVKLLKENKFIRYYFLFFIFLAWGMIWGALRKNGMENVFFDANAYVYFGLIFPCITTITSVEKIRNIFYILVASVSVVSLKTLLLLFLFSHKMYYAMEFLYKWVRDYRFAEITAMPQGFYRIFSQAHIYVLMAIFFMALILIQGKKEEGQTQGKEGKTNGMISFLLGIKQYDFKIIALYIIFLSVIAVDLSRSFWVGGFAAVLAMYLILFFALKFSYRQFLKFTIELALGVLMAFGLTWGIVKFPYPKGSVNFSADLLSDRATTVDGEQGASSRWNLLPVLVKAIKDHPVIGSGFGSAVTYKSNDPRILASNPKGEYTTYAFEWGYLDIILKIGVLGMFFYLLLIWKIGREGWNELMRSAKGNRKETLLLIIGILLGIIIILATSIFSPYMNHPLGIGYILLCSLAISILSSKKVPSES